MVDQQQPNIDRGLGGTMPKFIERPAKQQIIIEPTGAEIMSEWAWPIATWVIIFLNTLMAMLAVKQTWDSYSYATHYFMSGAFVMSMFGLACIHRYILRGKHDRHNN